MGLNNSSSSKNYFATDYMLETISFVYCLLFIYTFYLYKLDVSKIDLNLLNSQNNNTTISYVLIPKGKKLSTTRLMGIQSAENCKGFSETTRQLPDLEEDKF